MITLYCCSNFQHWYPLFKEIVFLHNPHHHHWIANAIIKCTFFNKSNNMHYLFSSFLKVLQLIFPNRVLNLCLIQKFISVIWVKLFGCMKLYFVYIAVAHTFVSLLIMMLNHNFSCFCKYLPNNTHFSLNLIHRGLWEKYDLFRYKNFKQTNWGERGGNEQIQKSDLQKIIIKGFFFYMY